jgi:HEAT repeat protein
MINPDFEKVVKDLQLTIKDKGMVSSSIMDNDIIKSIFSKYGIELNNIYDLINSREEYDDILPLLIKILQANILNDGNIIEGIVRALTVKEAKGLAEKTLLESYNSLKPDQRRGNLGWAYGNAIEYLYSDKNIDVDEIINIIREKSNGMSRQMFVLALGKTKKHKEKVENLLIELTNDSDVALHAITSLYKLKSIKAVPRMKELTNSPKAPIRKKAEFFLKKIGV